MITKKDIDRFKIDPTVKKFRKALLYSDYVDKKGLKLGHKENLKVMGKMWAQMKAKRYQDLIEKPALSVALKYVNDTKEPSSETNNDRASTEETRSVESEVQENDESMVFRPFGKPIHMPYASTDKYEILKDFEETETKFQMSELNEKYKALYEKYLESKETELNDKVLTKLFNEEEAKKNKDIVPALEPNRPAEDMTKVPPNWMTDYEQYADSGDPDESWKANYGTPKPNVPVSDVPCGGCGALLHCKDPAIPGYLPSELFCNQHNKILRSCTCQRCHFIKHYNTTLEVKVTPEEYPQLLGHLKNRKVAVILMVDLTDFPCSIWPGIMDIIGKMTRVFVVGNKVDLLPNDGPNFLKRVKESLVKSLHEAGIAEANIKSVNLISAKTGYGVEQLINTLHKNWGYKGLFSNDFYHQNSV